MRSAAVQRIRGVRRQPNCATPAASLSSSPQVATGANTFFGKAAGLISTVARGALPEDPLLHHARQLLCMCLVLSVAIYGQARSHARAGPQLVPAARHGRQALRRGERARGCAPRARQQTSRALAAGALQHDGHLRRSSRRHRGRVHVDAGRGLGTALAGKGRRGFCGGWPHSVTPPPLGPPEKKVIVAKLSAIEELAGMTILCSDKTGTLHAQPSSPCASPRASATCARLGGRVGLVWWRRASGESGACALLRERLPSHTATLPTHTRARALAGREKELVFYSAMASRRARCAAGAAPEPHSHGVPTACPSPSPSSEDDAGRGNQDAIHPVHHGGAAPLRTGTRLRGLLKRSSESSPLQPHGQAHRGEPALAA